MGCIFTQTKWDKEGYPIRDPASTTYTGAIENAEEFGKRIYLIIALRCCYLNINNRFENYGESRRAA